LDEPGTGLDVRSLSMLRDEIRTYREQGVSIVWISHHLRDDVAMADSVLCLAKRRVDYYGTAADFDAGRLLC